MENRPRDIHGTGNNESDISNIASSPSNFLVFVIFTSILVCVIAIVSAESPWFEWVVPDPVRGDKTVHTDIYQMLPIIRHGVVSTVGALRDDGNLVLTIGRITKFLIAFTLIISAWLMIKCTNRKWSIFLLFPFVCFFSSQLFWAAWADTEVWLANHETLPRLVSIVWKGPILIAICFLMQVGLLIAVKISENTRWAD